MSQVFPRPLFNAGRWYNRYQGFPVINDEALVEVSTGYRGLWRSARINLVNVRNYRVREVLPEGFVLPEKVVKPRRATPQTAREIEPNGHRFFSFSSHGGGCCGRYHLSGFSIHPSVTSIGSLKGQTTPRRCVEITLTEGQSQSKGWNGYTWDDVLKELGWKHVMTFNNGNSGNDVRVYLHSTTERPIK